MYEKSYLWSLGCDTSAGREREKRGSKERCFIRMRRYTYRGIRVKNVELFRVSPGSVDSTGYRCVEYGGDER
jgi:hypothetical protein